MTVYLVRHGSAGRRDGTDPLDDGRRLDDKGRRQAEALARVLGSDGVTAVLSSPLPRCVETVTPLAELLGTEVRIDPRLAEGTDIAQSWALLEEVACGDVVLCSHGDVIPDLVRRNQVRGMAVHGPSGWSKGSLWVLEDWRGDHFATARWEKPRRSEQAGSEEAGSEQAGSEQAR